MKKLPSGSTGGSARKTRQHQNNRLAVIGGADKNHRKNFKKYCNQSAHMV